MCTIKLIIIIFSLDKWFHLFASICWIEIALTRQHFGHCALGYVNCFHENCLLTMSRWSNGSIDLILNSTNGLAWCLHENSNWNYSGHRKWNTSVCRIINDSRISMNEIVTKKTVICFHCQLLVMCSALNFNLLHCIAHDIPLCKLF